MKKCVLFLTTIILLTFAHSLLAQGTAFTYQGQLTASSSPASGKYDFTFALYDNSSTNSDQVGSTLTKLDVSVADGLFIVTLNFGGVFTGTNYWLAIGVRTNGGASFTALSPLQALTPVPYAIFATTASNVSGVVASANLSGTYGNALALNNAANSFTGNGSGLDNLNASQLTGGTVPDGELSGNVALLDANQTFTGVNKFTGSNESLIIDGPGPLATNLFTGLGFQYDNNTGEGAIMSSYNDGSSSLTFYTKPGAGFPITKQVKIDRYGTMMIDQQNANYGALNDGTTNGAGLVFGTGGGEGIASQRTAGVNKNGLDFYTSNSRQMSILNNGNIGMGTTNPSTALQVSGTVTATAFAGNSSGLTNLNANNFTSGTIPNSVLSGFQGNFNTVGGGGGNTATNDFATVAGGQNNTASGQQSTVGGGDVNQATAQYATVSGGHGNQATTEFATVPGGDDNLASGKYSYAAGRQAQATNQGAFVWTDSQNAPFASTNNDSFNVRAQGGANFVTSGAGLTVDGQAVQVGNNGSSLTNVIAAAVATPPGMALVPAGGFTMGDTLDGEEDAIPTVSITVSAFYMDVNLVSFAQWQSVYYWATENGYAFDNTGFGNAPNQPVQTVNWYDCVKWCNARSQQAGLTPVYYTDAAFTQKYKTGDVDGVYANWAANGYGLPTEAEWEKAARGGLSGQRFPWGNVITESLANYEGDTADFSYDLGPNGYNSFNSGGGTTPVGYFAANGYGLYDMAGNVSGWCWDWYGTAENGTDDYGEPTTTNPTGPATGSHRVLRGGVWDNYAYYSRCADRDYLDPDYGYNGIGFRCVRGL